jgi:deoxyribonuclease V
VKACLDVCYRASEAIAGCVLFHKWPDGQVAGEATARLDNPAPYVPGRFYLRELPGLLAVLGTVSVPLDAIVVDGLVWLPGEERQGMGAHLYAALGGTIPVIGVAKSPFRGAPAVEVVRGKARRPLYVSAAGMAAEVAAGYVVSMHGAFRIPTLIRQADRLCRTAW